MHVKEYAVPINIGVRRHLYFNYLKIHKLHNVIIVPGVAIVVYQLLTVHLVMGAL